MHGEGNDDRLRRGGDHGHDQGGEGVPCRHLPTESLTKPVKVVGRLTPEILFAATITCGSITAHRRNLSANGTYGTIPQRPRLSAIGAKVNIDRHWRGMRLWRMTQS